MTHSKVLLEAVEKHSRKDEAGKETFAEVADEKWNKRKEKAEARLYPQF